MGEPVEKGETLELAAMIADKQQGMTMPNRLSTPELNLSGCENTESSGLKSALSNIVDQKVEELLNKEENRELLDRLNKASERVEMARKELAEIEKQEFEAKRMRDYIEQMEGRAAELEHKTKEEQKILRIYAPQFCGLQIEPSVLMLVASKRCNSFAWRSLIIWKLFLVLLVNELLMIVIVILDDYAALRLQSAQREVLEARAMVEEAERSLSMNMDGIGVEDASMGKDGDQVDRDEERWESVKAAVISALVGSLAGLPPFPCSCDQ
ncbi:hypothetical protein Ancab_015570 [Ancistrocladus abbreviatus]